MSGLEELDALLDGGGGLLGDEEGEEAGEGGAEVGEVLGGFEEEGGGGGGRMCGWVIGGRVVVREGGLVGGRFTREVFELGMNEIVIKDLLIELIQFFNGIDRSISHFYLFNFKIYF